MKSKLCSYGLVMLLGYLLGCQSVSQNVDKGVEATKDTLNTRTALQRTSFENIFSLRRNHIKDRMDSLRLDSLYTSVASTTLFLDSTRKLLDKLDPNELNYVRDHLMGLIGDSLYQKVNYTLKASAAFAAKPQQKNAIDSIYSNIFSQPDSRAWKNEYFGQTSVFGASMIIHGLGIEIYRAAQISLEQ
ncbi:hypothetical protein [Flavitalea sp.]|nr:hypothetical protein [Flavitalea sp.]